MKVISFDDIKQLNISPLCCYQWVSDAIKHKRDFYLPAKTHMAMPDDSFCNIMPSIISLGYDNCASCTNGG